MSLRVERTRAMVDMLEELKERVVPTALMGNCCSCGRGIPYGYLAVVTKWEAKVWGTGSQPIHVMVPVEVSCRDCSDRD